MDNAKCQLILQEYFDSINDRDYEKYLDLLLYKFEDKITKDDLNFVFGLNHEFKTEFAQFDLHSLSDPTSEGDFLILKMDYSFSLKDENDKVFNTDTVVWLFYDQEDETLAFLPYLPEKKELIFSFLPVKIVNEVLRSEEKSYSVDLIPYPEFEDVFTEETDPKAKFVFLPLVTIKIRNHEQFNDKTFHLISLWDTGDYETEYFGDYRIDVNEIVFDLVGDKLGYKDKIDFPKIEFLEEAYTIISEDFEIQKEYYLSNLNYKGYKSKIERGGNLILDRIPEFGKFESEYYFERVTSVLLSKYRFKNYGVINSCFDDNSFFKYKFKGDYSDEELEKIDFNKIGKIDFVDNLLLRPEFIQNDEFPSGTIFIGQTDEGDFISSSATNTFLFYNNEKEQQIQIFQWD